MAVLDDEVLAAGRRATMRVPLPFEWMSRLPPPGPSARSTNVCDFST